MKANWKKILMGGILYASAVLLTPVVAQKNES